MTARPLRFEIRCGHCGVVSDWTREQLRGHLLSLKFLRRAADIDDATLLELVQSSMAQGLWQACSNCGKQPGAAPVAQTDTPDEAWLDEIPCQRCGRLIPAERLELFPGCRTCVACQQKQDSGDDAGEVEYCPLCGDVLQLRLSSRGATSYRRYCPGCRRQF